jgi:hypothetical protein
VYGYGKNLRNNLKVLQEQFLSDNIEIEITKKFKKDFKKQK